MNLFPKISTVLILTFLAQAHAQDKWQIADEKVLRLKPAAFSQLPKNIALNLEKRGCTVPQVFGEAEPHNVIRGEFAKSGQFDWAVLCSRRRVSSILVFWKGSTRAVSEIARAADINFLQTIDGAGNAGFSRAIEAVGKDYILERRRRGDDGGKNPPPIRHQGINDAFVEKASSVYYLYRKRWLEFDGAD